jgi:hypothetical protein
VTAPEDLRDVWREIAPPPLGGALAGRTVSAGQGLQVTIAVDNQGVRHLLTPAHQGTKVPRNVDAAGLSVDVDELSVSGAPAQWYLDVSSTDPALNDNFAAVAAEIVDALTLSADPARTIVEIVTRWRFFWSVPQAGMSEEAQLGLFGELWFMEFWLGGIRTDTLAHWRGPLGNRHDFVSPQFSVEAKATRVRSDGGAIHRISTLDQLQDPEQGQLYLFSLRVRPDELAAHSLNTSIDRARGALRHWPEALAQLDELLGRVGYSPAHREKYAMTFRVTAEELYEVGAGFPRLVPDSFSGGLPAGVDDVRYSLDLAACSPWLRATLPSDEVAQLVRGGLLAD